jgi:hypothetical protein
VTLCASVTVAARLSREESDRLQRKIEEIMGNGSAVPVRPRKTRASEKEINSYLAFDAKNRIPSGLNQPEITLIGDGRLAGRVLVDLDEFKRHRGSGGLMDPLNYISGKVPVMTRGVLHTRDGEGQFYLESAEVHRLPLPKPILQEMVSFFTRTPERPEGLDIDAPFDLPAKIREVVIGKGQAVVVQ